MIIVVTYAIQTLRLIGVIDGASGIDGHVIDVTLCSYQFTCTQGTETPIGAHEAELDATSNNAKDLDIVGYIETRKAPDIIKVLKLVTILDHAYSGDPLVAIDKINNNRQHVKGPIPLYGTITLIERGGISISGSLDVMSTNLTSNFGSYESCCGGFSDGGLSRGSPRLSRRGVSLSVRRHRGGCSLISGWMRVQFELGGGE